jgi:hypothetical protein
VPGGCIFSGFFTPTYPLPEKKVLDGYASGEGVRERDFFFL